MKVLHELSELRRRRKPVAVAVGFFDGVHRGHRAILDATRACADEMNGRAWVLTFDTHPLRILNPAAAPPLLTSNTHKLRLLRRRGMDGCLLLPFTRETAATAAEDFVAALAHAAPPLRHIVAGRNWRFGHRGRGDPTLLRHLLRGTGVEVSVMRPRVWKGETISSTRIRAAVQRGSLDEAAAMLGRPYSVFGTVAGGIGLGRKLGYPTANLDVHNEALPPYGIYAARAILDRGRAQHCAGGVVSFGVRPTLGRRAGREPTCELHVFDFDGNLYGRDAEVFFVRKLRDERRFSSHRALAEQIGRDVAAARAVLADTHGRRPFSLQTS